MNETLSRFLEALRIATARHQPVLRMLIAKARGLRGKHDVAGHDNFESTRQRKPVHRGDHRQRTGFETPECPQQVVQQRVQRRLVFACLEDLRQVSASAKDFAFAAYNNGTHLGVAFERVHSLI